MTLTEKQDIRKQVLEERNKSIKFVEDCIRERNILESEYDKYFSEIQKYSNDFKLTKTVKQISRDVKYRTEDSVTITVDTVTMDYNECKITYVGKFPESRNSSIICLSVEKHVTYSRGYCRNSHGFKLKVRYDYNNEFWYKSVKSFVKKVNEFVESEFDKHNFQETLKSNKKIALDYVSEKFNQCSVITHTGNTITVTYANGVVVRMYFNVNNETKEVKLSIKETKIPSPNNQEGIINLVEALGKL